MQKNTVIIFYDSRALSMLLPLCFIVWKCLKKCWSPRKITLCLENDSIILSKQTREYRNHLYKNYSLEISSLFLNIKPNSKVKDTGENVGIHGKFLLQKLLMWTIKAPARTVARLNFQTDLPYQSLYHFICILIVVKNVKTARLSEVTLCLENERTIWGNSNNEQVINCQSS